MADQLEDVEFHSDDEVTEPSNPFAAVGAVGIEKMLALSIRGKQELRVKSKQGLKDLDPLLLGKPGILNKRNLVWNRFLASQEVLGKDRQAIPTTDDLCRFMTFLVEIVVCRSKHGVPSVQSMTNAYMHLYRVLAFHHPSADIFGKFSRRRIADAIDAASQKAQLTKFRSRSKCWISSKLLCQITDGLLAYHLQQGVRSWDISLQSIYMLLLQAALGARSGDIVMSPGYEGNVCLCWKDISLYSDSDKAQDHSDFQHLSMQVTQRFVKGHKQDDINRVSVFKAYNTPAHCIIVWTLVHAIRSKELAIESLDSIPQGSFLLWKNPDRPVFRQCNHGRTELSFDTPARNMIMTRTLRLGADRIGLKRKDLVPHDVRRGAIRDIAQAARAGHYQHIAGTHIDSAARFAGHSIGREDVTLDYIGSRDNIDTWQARKLVETNDDPFNEAEQRESTSDEITLEDILSAKDDNDDDNSDVEIDIMKTLEEKEEASSTSHAQSSSRPHSIASLSHRDFVLNFATINTSTLTPPGEKIESATHLMTCVNCDRQLSKTRMKYHRRYCKTKTREEGREHERKRQLAASSEQLPCDVAGCSWAQSRTSSKSGKEKTQRQLRGHLVRHKKLKHEVTKDVNDTASDHIPGLDDTIKEEEEDS